MADLDDHTERRYRHLGYQRLIQIHRVIQTMKGGGTCYDVRDAVAEKTGSRLSVDAVRTSLWCLYDLGLATFDSCGNARIWRAA